MCLAIPMRVTEIEGNLGHVESAGIKMTIALDLVDDVRPGDFVIVHAGFAITRLSAEEAEENLAFLQRLSETESP